MNQEQEQLVKPVLSVSSLLKEMLLVKPVMLHATAVMEPPLLASTVQSTTNLQGQETLAPSALLGSILLKETLPAQTAMLPAPLVMGLLLSA